MGKLLKKYYAPTPVKCRKIGDIILILGALINTTILTEYEKAKEIFGTDDLKHWVAISIALTVLGKIVTNFCTGGETSLPATEEK